MKTSCANVRRTSPAQSTRGVRSFFASTFAAASGGGLAPGGFGPAHAHAWGSKECVTVTLVADATYQLVTSTAATVSLFDDEKPELRITATDSAAGEANANGGLFSVTAIPAPNANLSIAFTVRGTATQGTDYAALASPLTLQAGATSVGLPVSPIDDAVKEGSETVVVTLTAATAYTVGTSSATVSVADND